MVGEAAGMWVSDEAMKYKRFVDALPAHREPLDHLPGAVEQVLVQAMSMHPEERHATPNDLAAALEQAVQRKPAYNEAQVRAATKRPRRGRTKRWDRTDMSASLLNVPGVPGPMV